MVDIVPENSPERPPVTCDLGREKATTSAPATDDHRSGETRGWLLPALLAAGLCLVCLLPVIGGLLAARGLLPTAWNPGEAVYLLGGGIVLGGWAAVRFLPDRRLDADATGPLEGGAGPRSSSCGCGG